MADRQVRHQFGRHFVSLLDVLQVGAIYGLVPKVSQLWPPLWLIQCVAQPLTSPCHRVNDQLRVVGLGIAARENERRQLNHRYWWKNCCLQRHLYCRLSQ